MNLFTPNVARDLTAILADGATARYPRALVYVAAAIVDTIDLAHVGNGMYAGAWTPTASQPHEVVFLVYSDAGHTVLDATYDRMHETWLPSSNIADAVHQRIVEGTLTLEQAVRLLLAALAGSATGLEGPAQVFKSIDGTKNRIVGTYAAGTRTVTGRDGT